MKKIILHCGMPKSGSSALQVQLSQSHDGLMKNGYNYLNIGDFELTSKGKISSGNGAHLARAYLHEKHPANMAETRDEITNQFVDAIKASEEHVILSSEFFSTIPHSYFPILVEALSEVGEVELIYLVRDQINAIASNYIQRVKRKGLRQYPDEYFTSWDGFKAPLMYFSYFDRLKKSLPGIRISALPYELSKSNPSGLMGLFLEMIGAQIPAQELAADLKINLSPSPKEIRLMLEVNKHNPRVTFSDMLVESSQKSGRSTIHTQHMILPPHLVDEIYSFFKEDNEAFFEHIAHSKNIYQAAEGDYEFVDLKEIVFEANDVADIITGLLADMDKRIAKLEKR